MRILHVSSTLERGGIASSLWYLLPVQAAEAGVQVEAVDLFEKGWYGERLKAQGIGVQWLQLGHKYSPRGLARLVGVVRRGRFDVVQAHGWPAVLFVALVSLAAPRPAYVLSEHNVTNRRRRLGLKLLDRFLYSRFGAVVAVSRAAAEALAGWLPGVEGKMSVIYNGLDPARVLAAPTKSRAELGVAAERPLIFAAGTLEHRKGLDVFLQAMRELPEVLGERGETGEPSTMPMALIAGDGPLRSSLEALAEELGMADHVHFLGFRDDLPAIMAAADLFVLSSRWEGCPMVVLEAMALGLPVAASAVGGVPELLEDGQSGVLVEPDNPQALAMAMAGLMRDREAGRRLGENGRERLKACFLAETGARQMTALYRRMCEPADWPGA